MFIHTRVRVCVGGARISKQTSEQVWVPRPSLGSGGGETLHDGGKVGGGIRIQGSLMVACSRELRPNLCVYSRVNP